MGFFKRFSGHNEDREAAPPPMPTNQDRPDGSLDNMPPAPPPLNMDEVSPRTTSPPDSEMEDPNTDFSIPPLESPDMLPESPFSDDNEFNVDDSDKKPETHNSSFAEQFGTHPDPEIQDEIHQNFEEHQSNVEKPDLEEDTDGDFSFGNSSLDVLEGVKPREARKENLIGMNELPIEQHINHMIDEHVEDKIAEKEIPSPTPIKPKEEFKEIEKPIVPHNLVPKKPQVRTIPKVDPSKPLFVRLEFCGALVTELTDIRSLLKKRDDDYLSFVELEKELDKVFNNWKGNLESLQSNLIKMDKLVFKD